MESQLSPIVGTPINLVQTNYPRSNQRPLDHAITFEDL